MMEHLISPGSWVRSTAGSDCGSVYWVLRREGDVVWLVDGKRHRLSNPKKKNLRHIQTGDWVQSEHPILSEPDTTLSQSELLKWEAILRKMCRKLETKE